MRRILHCSNVFLDNYQPLIHQERGINAMGWVGGGAGGEEMMIMKRHCPPIPQTHLLVQRAEEKSSSQTVYMKGEK